MWWWIGGAALAAGLLLWWMGRERHHQSLGTIMAEGQGEAQFDIFFKPLTFKDLGPISEGGHTAIASTLRTLGFEGWHAYLMPDMHVLVEVASGPQGSVAVHTHPLFGTWFDMWAMAETGAHIWSNSPLFSPTNTVHPFYQITHHRLMTVHEAINGVAQIEHQMLMTPEQLIEHMGRMHDKNIGQFVVEGKHNIDHALVQQWLWGFVPSHIDRQHQLTLGKISKDQGTVMFEGQHPCLFTVWRADGA